MNIQEYRYRHTGTAVSRGVAGRRLRAGLAAAVLTLAAGVLAGCSGLLDKVGTDTPSGTYITLSAENGRTVLPVIGAADLTDLVLTGTLSGGSGSTLGSWETYGAMKQASVAVMEGSWAFTLTGEKDGTKLCGTLKKTIVKGSNSLSFTLEVTSYAQTESGTGNVNVTVYYPSGKAGAVTAECINDSTGGDAGGTVTYTEGSGVYSGMTGATYTAEGVASGKYELSFTFYCDAAETVLLDNTWNELVCIADGTTSSAVRVIDSFDDINTITYNLNGGSWTSGTVYPESFCIKSNVALPADGITRSGYAFNCWYTDESCTNGIAGWDAGTTTGNVELWAGWTIGCVTGFTAATAGSTQNGGAQIVLTWTTPDDSDFSKAVVTWTTTADTGTQVGTKEVRGTAGCTGSYTVTGLTNGTSYTFTVKAADRAGNKSSGVTVTATAKTAEIGQIYYTNGTVLFSYDSRLTPVGIVCAVKDDGSVKTIVALTESSKYLMWAGHDGSETIGYKTMLETSLTDGKANTKLVEELSDYSGRNYPAFGYCKNYSVSGLAAAWYIPARDELGTIYTNKTAINTGLNTMSSGGVTATQLGTGCYWSSSQYNENGYVNYAWYVIFSDGFQYFNVKYAAFATVRCVAGF